MAKFVSNHVFLFFGFGLILLLSVTLLCTSSEFSQLSSANRAFSHRDGDYRGLAVKGTAVAAVSLLSIISLLIFF